MIVIDGIICIGLYLVKILLNLSDLKAEQETASNKW